MKDNEKTEYNNLLMKLYEKNQTFLDVTILGGSALAIPFLWYIINLKKYSLFVLFGLIIALILFSIVIFLHLKALNFAKNGCDISLNDDYPSLILGEKLFNKARKIDVWRDRCFFIAFFFVIISTLINIIY